MPEQPSEPRLGPDPVASTTPGTRVTLRSRFTVDVGPLRRYRDFRLLWAGQAVTFFGSMITYVAVPYQLYSLTRSTFAVGLLGLVDVSAILLVSFIGGALADSVDRRRMVFVTEAGLLLCSGVLVANASLGHPHVAVLYVFVALLSVFDSLQRPSLDALLPRLVPREDLLAAGALASLRSTVGQIAGPAVGGLLVVGVGLPGTYSIDVATFAVSLVLLSRMRAVPPSPDATPPSLRGVLEGLRYARSRPELVGTYVVDINAMFFGMPNALFPALAVALGGSHVLGLLYAAPAVGGLVAGATSGWSRHVHHHGQAVLWAAAGWGAAIAGFGFASSLWPALLFLALAGFADEISGLFRMTIWNTTIPDHLRGRLAGIELIGYSSGPTLGSVEAGGVAAFTSPRFSAGLGGVLCVVGTAACAVLLPEFRRYDARSAGQPEPHLSA